LKSGDDDASKNESYNSIIFAKCNNYDILLISLEFGKKSLEIKKNLRNDLLKKIKFYQRKKCL
jgi:hypothetical protein